LFTTAIARFCNVIVAVANLDGEAIDYHRRSG
jgi:hypothetical protein